MSLAHRWLQPGPAAQHRADLGRSVMAARAVVLLAGAAAVVVAAALFLRERQLDAATVGLAGVTTAIVADALLRFIGWHVQRSVESDAPDRRAEQRREATRRET